MIQGKYLRREYVAGTAFVVPRCNRRFCRLTDELLQIGRTAPEEPLVAGQHQASDVGGHRADAVRARRIPTVLCSPPVEATFSSRAEDGELREPGTRACPQGRCAALAGALPARTGRAVAESAGAYRAFDVAATRPASRDLGPTAEHMMRSLHVSIAIATSAVLLAACDDGMRRESATARSRESSLARDLALAGDSSLARQVAQRDSHAVSESSGMLDSTAAAESATTVEMPGAPVASNASSRPAPSAEGYIGPSCASPARDDQQRCLMGYLAKSDALLDRYYQALILRLKSEAGVKSDSEEPPAVQRLRSAQRAWLVYRDDECRRRTKAREGPLWAPVRAQCLAEYSSLRARELDDALAKRKALAAREKSAKSKSSTARKTTRRSRTGER